MSSTVERAFALARAGACRTLPELRHRLRMEGCESVDCHLAGKLIKSQLNALMAGAQPGGFAPPPPQVAEMALRSD